MAGRDVNVQMGLTSVDEVSFMMLPGKVTEYKTWFLQSDSTRSGE